MPFYLYKILKTTKLWESGIIILFLVNFEFGKLRKFNIMRKASIFLILTLLFNNILVLAEKENLKDGKFHADWESLSRHDTPEWFRDAKFGIWAHWGPQCQPEYGDWYAKLMYLPDNEVYRYHVENYGHPSEFGFKDVINEWTAPNWDPKKLVELYKKTGAKYFFAMGNHHDNFDLWNSKFHNWNSTKIGPKRDILAEWKEAADENDLPFGVSIHSSHTWTWFEPAQGSDPNGPYAGVKYDAATLSFEDGKGKWWEGYDPQELYQQNHSLSDSSQDVWDWPEGTSMPTQEYLDDFYNRTTDMISKYQPDLIYFDDTVVPFWPIDNTGLEVISYFYNDNLEKSGKDDAEVVVFGKQLKEPHKQAIVWDVEKGVPSDMQELAWQTCTCLGNWHYDKRIYDNNWYKSAKTVANMLVDIVSKNGNLLLSVPIKGDGTIDEKEEAILNDLGDWFEVNGEGIFATRPWLIYGEGPSTLEQIPLNAQGFNEGNHAPYTSEDIRFVTKNGNLYAHVLEWPEDNKVLIKSLSSQSPYFTDKIHSVSLLGGGDLEFVRNEEGLEVTLPNEKPNPISFALEIK